MAGASQTDRNTHRARAMAASLQTFNRPSWVAPPTPPRRTSRRSLALVSFVFVCVEGGVVALAERGRGRPPAVDVICAAADFS